VVLCHFRVADGDLLTPGCCRWRMDVAEADRLRAGLAEFASDVLASLTKAG
jgi:hypothetical protein